MSKSEISGSVFGLIGRNDNIEMKKLIKSTLSTLCQAGRARTFVTFFKGFFNYKTAD